jgi:signal transduction histidine kinase/CheY-like chemotaxis protein
MEEPFSFFNFSFQRIIDAEHDSFKKARLKIAFTILIISLIKIFIAVFFAVQAYQHRQIVFLVVFTAVFLFLMKLLLWRPSLLTTLSHIMLISGIAFIWLNLFLFAQHISITTVQFIVMIVLISYYLVGGVMAAVYSISAALSVFLFLLFKDLHIQSSILPVQISPSGANIIIGLNFVSFILSHYLFYRAFKQNLADKEALNEELRANITEVKALAESRSVFLSTMSHELRTPLNGVIGMASLLKQGAHPDQTDNLDLLEFSATNLLAVINDILDYNKSELDKIELEVIPVNLEELLVKIGYGLKWKAIEKKLTWNMDIDETLKGVFVKTDPTRLTQIIHNLAGNALKFTDTGSVAISAKVANRADEAVTVAFAVRDTGIGIAADRQEAIFHPFTQASSNTTRKYGGTGLGLAIVKRLLKLFNSDIMLESEPGEGSTFSFTITFAISEVDQSPAPLVATSKKSLKGLKILVAEDNEINYLLLEKLLSRWDIETKVTTNGQEALDEVLTNHYDCILMDLHMPVMDGYTASATIRQLSDAQKAAIRIIAVTASVSRNVNHKIKEAGIDDYLSKPFNSDLLYQKLQTVHERLYK